MKNHFPKKSQTSNTQSLFKKQIYSNNPVIVNANESEFAKYVKRVYSFKNLSAQEEFELCKKIKAGDKDAKKVLVNANLKLVFTIAKKNIHISKIPYVDLIQEGNLGLMIAAEKFNYKLGYRFSTYAAWWIKQSMFKAISEQAYCMKIPVYVQETLSKFSKIKSQLEQKYNCSVKNEEVAKEMNIEPEKIDVFLNAYNKAVSIESEHEISNGNEVSLSDILVDETSSATKNIEFISLQNDINYVVGKLKEREADVVRMRYGLDDLRRRTLEEIGNLYGVTKECIRQTELRAIKKIRMLVEKEGLLAGYAS